MDLNESFCLIDWDAPSIPEQTNMVPLIPLPVFSNDYADIAGDNPFDYLERKLDEAKSFDVPLDTTTDDKFSEICQFLSKLSGMEDGNEPEFASANYPNTHSDLPKILDKLQLENELRKDDSFNVSASNVSAIPNLSFSESCDIKEMVSSRIAECINRTLKDIEDNFHTGKGPEYRGHDSGASRKSSSTESSGNSLNKGFLNAYNTSPSIDQHLLSIAEDKGYKDLEAVTPPWDEMMYSSDDENDKMMSKWSSAETAGSAGDARRGKLDARILPPLKESEVRIRKPEVGIKKPEPLKALIPVQKMAKPETPELDITPMNQDSRPKNAKADSSSLNPKRRSFPLATSTPRVTLHPSDIRNKTPPSAKRAVSPDSTSTSRLLYRPYDRESLKGCVRRLTSPSSTKANVLTTRASGPQLASNASVSRSTTYGNKSFKTKINKENVIPFRN